MWYATAGHNPADVENRECGDPLPEREGVRAGVEDGSVYYAGTALERFGPIAGGVLTPLTGPLSGTAIQAAGALPASARPAGLMHLAGNSGRRKLATFYQSLHQ